MFLGRLNFPASILPDILAQQEKRFFSVEELRNYDGRNGSPVYVGAKGIVFDMTAARDKYGPGGPYAVFAGRDASRALAKHSLDAKEAENPNISDLSSSELQALDDWFGMFQSKYNQIGTIGTPQPGPKNDH